MNKISKIALITGFSLCLGLIIIGTSPIKPNNINWLFIANPDPLTHYLGWLFFKSSGWSIPIGLNPSYGLEISSSIVFSDSIPLLAIFFKVFKQFLSQEFQYFGIWYLLSLTLQGLMSWLLIGLISRDWVVKLFAIGIFILSPPMLARVGVHSALVGHFLIIASIYLYLKKPDKNDYLYWLAILVAALLVQFYIFSMVLILWASYVFTSLLKCPRSFFSAQSLKILLTAILVIFFAWQAGYFVVANAAAQESGFGFYRATLHTFFNPLNNYNGNYWSFLRFNFPTSNEIYQPFMWPLNQGEHEGFNYLGLGTILLIPFGIYYLFQNRHSFNYLREQMPLAFTLIVLCTFALSNNITFLDHNFHYSLHPWLLKIANTLRCSGRMLWPVFYFFVFFLIYSVIRSCSINLSRVFLGIAFIIQLIDTSPGWMQIRNTIHQNSSISHPSIFTSNFWPSAAKTYSSIKIEPVLNSQFQPQWEHIAYFAARNRLSTNAVYLARVDDIAVKRANQQFKAALRSRNFDNAFFILDDSQLLRTILSIDPNKDLLAKINNFVVFAPNWRQCSTCPQDITSELIYPSPYFPKDDLFTLDSQNNQLRYLLAGFHGWKKLDNGRYQFLGPDAKISVPFPQFRHDKIILKLSSENNVSILQDNLSFTLNDHSISPIYAKVNNMITITFNIPDKLESDSVYLIKIHKANSALTNSFEIESVQYNRLP